MSQSSREITQKIHIDEKSHKILASLVKHVYLQGNVAMISSLFCASIIFAGLFNFHQSNLRLYIWSLIYLFITLIRMIIFRTYQYSTNSTKNSLKKRYYLYILGSFLGGLSWGIVGWVLFPDATTAQQTLIILMVAGVSAGVVPLSAAIPAAGILFLVAAIGPLIYSIAQVNNTAYFLFNIAIPIYLGYNIIIMMRTYGLIKNLVILKFENDALLNTLAISNKNLERAATHDPLTHVANRRLFESNLKNAIQRASVSESRIALFYVDLDNFKLMNDTYGHHVGDDILLIIATRLKNFFRKEDLISRLGGDEFAVILEYAHSTGEIESIANRICQLIAIPIPIESTVTELRVTASIGIALYPEDGSDEEKLILCADRRMYRSKDHGGNCFYLDDVTEMPIRATLSNWGNRDLNE